MKGKRVLALLVTLALTVTTLLGNSTFVSAIEISNNAKSVGNIYYVDADGGSDSNDGKSEGTAWKSLEKINDTTFEPGDTLSFKRGCSWTGLLSPKGSGEKGNPITINAYGNISDGRPVINGNSWCGDQGDDLENKVFNAAVFFYNQQYWNITSLEVTNFDPNHKTDDGSDECHIKKYGILIMGKDAGTLNGMNCTNLYVHSVISIPIGQAAGVGRGGIIYAIRGNSIETNWNDITVEGNYVKDVNHYGINFISTWGSSLFPDESGIPSSEGAYRSNSTNITIRGNYLENIGNAAICPSAYDEILIEKNICNKCNSGPNGNVPIGWENGDKTICQYNEVFGSGASDSKEDSQAFDADVNATLNYVQYNYTHDNPSGSFFECSLGSAFETYYRYNISVNDGYGSNIYDGGAVITLQNPRNGTLDVYNNLIYMDADHDGQITSNWDGSGTADLASSKKFTFTNNIIITEKEDGVAWNENYKGVVNNNAYGGANTNNRRADDVNGKTASVSDFVSLKEGTSGSVNDVDGTFVLTYGTVDQYKIVDGATVVDKGVAVIDNGGKDYFGSIVDELAKPNIGADNNFNTKQPASPADNELYITFNDRDDGELTGEYENCDFGNRGWNVTDNELWATAYTKDAQANKIAIPDGYRIKSFQATCTSGTASIKVEAGDENKTFDLDSSIKTYKTGFSNNDSAIYFVIDATAGVDKVKIDNIILEKGIKITGQDTNVTRGKDVTTSSVSPWDTECVGSNIVDGDTSSLWISNGWDDNGDKSSIIANCVVNLNDAYQLTNFDITFGGDQASSAWKYKIQGSTDNLNWDTLWDQSENTEVAKTQSGNIDSAYKDNKYNYVRVIFTEAIDNAWPAIAEFNAYQPEKAVNFAEGKTATVSSISPYGSSASNGNDGDESTLWVGNGEVEKAGSWWMVDLGEETEILSFDIIFECKVLDTLEAAQAADTPVYGKPWQYKVEGSTDKSSWDMLWDNTSNTSMEKEQSEEIAPTYANSKYRYVRVTLTQLPLHKESQVEVWPAFSEFKVLSSAPVDEGDDTDTLILTEKGQNIDIDLAYSQPVKASSTTSGLSGDNATDRKETTWKPESGASEAILQINLDREYDLENFGVDFEGSAQPYKFYVYTEGSWKEAGTCDGISGQVTNITEKKVEKVKFEFSDATSVEVKELHFDGVDSGVSNHQKILVLAPHEDDEMLMAGGVINRAVNNGDEVYVVYGTNGDFNGVSQGKTRISDTVNAMKAIGLDKSHLFFLGYADNGGMGVGSYATAFTDSFIYSLYMSDDNTVLSSRNGVTQTYGNEDVIEDYHYQKTGQHADYTRANFLADLKSVMETVNPTDIYMQSRYDMHYDHAYFGIFATEVIDDIRAEDTSFKPTVHEGIIHSHMTDEVYPNDQGNYGDGSEDSSYLGAWKQLEGLEEKTSLRWADRENVLVPYSMRQMPFKYNIKDQGLREYTTEYYNWIASFVKVSEVFYKKTFDSIAQYATVTASSENSDTDKSKDQSAIKAVDGIADGYATGLANSHNRFPFAEWVSNNEGAGAWLNLSFDKTKEVNSIKLYDRPNLEDQIIAAHLEFDDGTQINVGELPNDGSPKEISLGEGKRFNSVKLVIDGVSTTTTSVGLAEIEVFGDEAE